MKYDIVHIKPALGGKGWETYIQIDDQDRESGKTSPNGLGFYYFPRKMGKRKGFQKLKNYLIKRHKNEIKQLQKSLVELKNLKYSQ
jgi:hypothetical protein